MKIPESKVGTYPLTKLVSWSADKTNRLGVRVTFAWLLKVKVCAQEKRESEDDSLESAEFVYTMSEVFPIFGI